MTIYHKIDKILVSLFPEVAENDNDAIIAAIKQYYTQKGIVPIVIIEGEFVKIEINTEKENSPDEKFAKAVKLCDNRKFFEAKQILRELIIDRPTNSEYYRLLGQIHSEEGDNEKAVDYLIDALKWNPENHWALLMMGNIFVKDKKDYDIGLSYFNRVLELKPKDNLTLNNIAVILLETGKYDEAKQYFDQAIQANPDYPNSYHGLAMIDELEGNQSSAFNNSVLALKKNERKDRLYESSMMLAINAAKKLIQSTDVSHIIEDFASKLTKATGKDIRIKKDESISTYAKIEYAEVHKRDHHLLVYKSDNPFVQHLMMHELMHLELAHEARKHNENMSIVTNQKQRQHFGESLKEFQRKLSKAGYPEMKISMYLDKVFEGIISQAFNTPIDLFIEDKLYSQHEKLRPFQFLSLIQAVDLGIKSTTDKVVLKYSPASLVSKSKIYCLVNTLHLRGLFGVDKLSEHNPTPIETNQSERLYEEFLDYRYDREPGEEYELVKHWAKDLNLSKYFDLVNDEKLFAKSDFDADSILSKIENDPYDLDSDNNEKDREFEDFKKGQEDIGTNMAVVMYMVGALKYFGKLSHEEVKKVAMEIALQGAHGYDVKREGYKLNTIPGKVFTGYQIMAYFYVSWAIAMPDMLPQLDMPYEKEYQMAVSMIEEG